MVPPVNLIFKFFQQQSRVQIWLYEQNSAKIQGKICGFDEFMNVVVGDAVEVDLLTNSRKKLGRILLKGDNISLISSLDV